MILIGILIPFVGTVLGSSFVFLCKKNINIFLKKLFLGFAAGVMLAASIWSLLIPSMEMVEGNLKWFPSSIGVVIGVCLMFGCDKIINYFEFKKNNMHFNKNSILNFAITIHNIPEGMAIGVAIAAAINMGIESSMISAISIALGIAIQNIPEGMAISLPLRIEGNSRKKSFIAGVISGMVEPIAAIITIMISGIIESIMPLLLALAAGCMLYVVIKELIPESQIGKYSNMRSNWKYIRIFNNDDIGC